MDQLEHQILFLLRRLARLAVLRSRQLVHHHGLTSPQLVALHALVRAGELSPGALAREIQLSPPTVTGILDRLERKGLVQRARSECDRRSVVVRATAAAAEVVGAELPLLHPSFSHRLAELSEYEKASMVNALNQLAALMSDEPAPAPVVVDAGADPPLEPEPPFEPEPDPPFGHN